MSYKILYRTLEAAEQALEIANQIAALNIHPMNQGVADDLEKIVQDYRKSEKI